MDTARYAEMADPDRNPNFRRNWDAPPLKAKSPPMGGTIGRADFEDISSEKRFNACPILGQGKQP